MRNLFCISVTFWAINFTAINKECFNKNPLKISQHLPENACVVSFFIKLLAFSLQDFKFLRTPILKNICQRLTSAFFKLILWNSWKKSNLKTKWQKLINKYENTFIWTLHAAMKRNHWNVSLNLYYRNTYLKMYCFK